jgi:hypothetical protein
MQGLRKLNEFARGGNPRIPDEVIEGIIHRDALKVLGIAACRSKAEVSAKSPKHVVAPNRCHHSL